TSTEGKGCRVDSEEEGVECPVMVAAEHNPIPWIVTTPLGDAENVRRIEEHFHCKTASGALRSVPAKDVEPKATLAGSHLNHGDARLCPHAPQSKRLVGKRRLLGPRLVERDVEDSSRVIPVCHPAALHR